MCDILGVLFDGPRIGKINQNLSYPTSIFQNTPTIFIPMDETLEGGIGIWRTMIEVYNPAINQTTPLLGSPTGRFRKYELLQNPNGTYSGNISHPLG